MNPLVRLLVVPDDAPRALLFNGERQPLGEVIEEDGFIADRLLRSASERPSLDWRMRRALMPPQSPGDCVRLDGLR